MQSRYLSWPAYLVAIAMILLPLVDTWTSLFPWRFGDSRWRFGAVGMLSNALMLPMVGLLIAYVIACLREQRAVLRTISIVALVCALLSVLALGSFALDALETRAKVRPEMLRSFNVASVTAAMKTLLAASTFLAFGVCGWKASVAMTRSPKAGEVAGRLFMLPSASPVSTAKDHAAE